MENRMCRKWSQDRKRAAMWAAVPFLVGVMGTQQLQAQKFDVASVRACHEVPTDRRLGASASPGRFTSECSSVADLIQLAYIRFANGHLNEARAVPISISGGPAWINSERF